MMWANEIRWFFDDNMPIDYDVALVILSIFIGLVVIPQTLNFVVFTYINRKNISRTNDGVNKIRAAVCFWLEERVGLPPKYKKMIIFIKRPEAWDQRSYNKWQGEKSYLWSDQDADRGDDINMPGIMESFDWKVAYLEFPATRYFWSWRLPGNQIGWARQILRVNDPSVWTMKRLDRWCDFHAATWTVRRGAADANDPRIRKYAVERGLTAPLGITPENQKPPSSTEAEGAVAEGNVVEMPDWQKAVRGRADDIPAE